jgi:hypothetical protein
MLKTYEAKIMSQLEQRECKKHGLTTFRLEGKRWRCRECLNGYIRKARQKFLDDIRNGKCCERCGYDRIPQCLRFHHRDPSVKEGNVTQLYSFNFTKAKKEIDKCHLLCGTCHDEVHYLKDPEWLEV